MDSLALDLREWPPTTIRVPYFQLKELPGQQSLVSQEPRNLSLDIIAMIATKASLCSVRRHVDLPRDSDVFHEQLINHDDLA
jgi:hypothetical protein